MLPARPADRRETFLGDDASKTAMIPSSTQAALKEWATVVAALRQGRQILLLRKGGIHDRSGRFQPVHERFVFFATFEHQKRELLKPDAVERYGHLLDPDTEKGPLLIDTYAELTEAIRLRDASPLPDLEGEHIWNEAYVRMRVEYKPELPLFVLLLKVYALPRELEIPRLPRYAGCRSWVELDEKISVEEARPVLADEAFAEHAATVKAAIDG